MSAIVTLTKNSLRLNQQEQYMEMIARKPTPIFPILSSEVSGLDLSEFYVVSLTIERRGSARMGYDKNSKKWAESQKRGTKGSHEYKLVKLAGGAKIGKELMENGVEFGNAKISAREQDKGMENVIFLNTMHQYRPVITIISSSLKCTVVRAEIDECVFIPVTVYQSPTIGQWKSSFNKYATVKNGGKGAGNSEKIEETQRKKKSIVQVVEKEPECIDPTANQENLAPWIPMDTVPPPMDQYWNQQYPPAPYTSYPAPPMLQGFQDQRYHSWPTQYYAHSYTTMPVHLDPIYSTPSTTVAYPGPSYAQYPPNYHQTAYQGYGYH